MCRDLCQFGQRTSSCNYVITRSQTDLRNAGRSQRLADRPNSRAPSLFAGRDSRTMFSVVRTGSLAANRNMNQPRIRCSPLGLFNRHRYRAGRCRSGARDSRVRRAEAWSKAGRAKGEARKHDHETTDHGRPDEGQPWERLRVEGLLATTVGVESVKLRGSHAPLRS